MGNPNEQIITIEREKLFDDGLLEFQGVLIDKRKRDRIISNLSTHYKVMRRGSPTEPPSDQNAELNFSYKQPIAYAVLIRGDEIFVYERLSGGGESRLHGQLSVGVGGHVNDVDEVDDFEAILNQNVIRELDEELDVESAFMWSKDIGFINDDSEDVSRVHLGYLVALEMAWDAKVEVREKEQLKGKFVPIQELKSSDEYSRLENWSQIAVDAILKVMNLDD